MQWYGLHSLDVFNNVHNFVYCNIKNEMFKVIYNYCATLIIIYLILLEDKIQQNMIQTFLVRGFMAQHSMEKELVVNTATSCH